METKVPTSKKIREISPIKRNNDEVHNLNQHTTITSSKSTNFQTIKNKSPQSTSLPSKYNTITQTSQIKTKYPKNINEYKHLMSNFQLSQSDLDWTLYLRTYKPKKSRYVKINPSTINPPTFYEEDFSKYKTKSHLTTMPEPFLNTDNTFKLSHLVKRKLNYSQLNFESTLRDFRVPKGARITKHSQKWKNLAYNPVTTHEDKFLPPIIPNDKENLQRIDKYVLRGYLPTYDEVSCGDRTIRRKKLVPDMKSTLDYFGEHLSMTKYSQKYPEKNIQGIRHILANHSNSMSNFELGLREGYDETTKIHNNKKRAEIIAKNIKIKQNKSAMN